MDDSTDRAIRRAIFDMTKKSEKLKRKQKKKLQESDSFDDAYEDEFRRILEETTGSTVIRAPQCGRRDGRRRGMKNLLVLALVNFSESLKEFSLVHFFKKEPGFDPVKNFKASIFNHSISE